MDIYIIRTTILSFIVSMLVACSSLPTNIAQPAESSTRWSGGQVIATRDSRYSQPPVLSQSSKRSTEVQVGMASWYGRQFHGRRTSSSPRFDMHAMTAAHRTLPFGTRVRVTRFDNVRSVVVKINDRGPFMRGTVINLSRAQLRELVCLIAVWRV